MAFRRLTRSLSKTLDYKSPDVPTTSINSIIRRSKNKKQIRTQTSESRVDLDDEMMGLNVELSCEQLEAALDPAADFLPSCFQSQPRPTVPLSQQSDAASLSFASELLRASELLPSDSWKYACDQDDDLSSPATQLHMVSGIDQVLETSSLLYSPASVAPVLSPAPDSSPAPLTTAEELLQFYLPSVSHHVPDEDSALITDEALLEDLDDILLSYQSDVPDQEDSLSNIHIGFNPPADTVELALSSQYEPGLFVIEDQSSDSDTTTDTDSIPVAAPSRKGKTVAKKAVPVSSTSNPTKRGRKRKASSDSDGAEERKRRQNAEAAKNYRKRKAEQMNKVFEEKEEVEKELEKVRKRLSAKMNERNILLKMLYESYRENGDSAPHKILFPPWIQTWYQKQMDD